MNKVHHNRNLRLPAEWEPADAVVVAWPNASTDWAYMLDDVRKTYSEIICAISERAKVMVIGPELPSVDFFPDSCRKDNLIFAEVPINDTWTRDYGPIVLLDSDGKPFTQDFVFNGWGLKFASNKDNQIVKRLHAEGFLNTEYIGPAEIVLEGGSIESDGNGTILTTEHCLLAPNRNDCLSQYEIETKLLEQLGAKKILWLKHGHLTGDDTDGHIDTLARIAPPGDVIIYTGCDDPSDEHFDELEAMRDELKNFTNALGVPFHLIELPLPDPVYDSDDSSRLPATYANYLIVNGAVLMPTYGQPKKDRLAAMILESAMPEYEIIPIDCRSLVRQHGSLHCATMQLPLGTLKV